MKNSNNTIARDTKMVSLTYWHYYKNDPFITENEAAEQNVDLKKVINHCNVYHCG